MGSQRSALRALVMGFVPLLHIYLFWKFCNEAKMHWKLGRMNSTIYAVMLLIPIVNIYPLFRLLCYVKDSLMKEGKKAYLLPPIYLSIIANSWVLGLIPPVCPFILPVAWIAWLYIVYATQSLFNENGVESL